MFIITLCSIQNSLWRLNGSYLKVVHAVGQRHHEPGVIVDGLVTENDIHAVVEIPEIVLGCRQLTAVVLWVIPGNVGELGKLSSHASLFHTHRLNAIQNK